MLNNTMIKSRLIFVIGFLSLLMTSIGILGLTSLATVNQSLRTVYEDRLVALGQLNSKDLRKTDASVVGSPRRTTVLSSASRLASAILRKS